MLFLSFATVAFLKDLGDLDAADVIHQRLCMPYGPALHGTYVVRTHRSRQGELHVWIDPGWEELYEPYCPHVVLTNMIQALDAANLDNDNTPDGRVWADTHDAWGRTEAAHAATTMPADMLHVRGQSASQIMRSLANTWADRRNVPCSLTALESACMLTGAGLDRALENATWQDEVIEGNDLLAHAERVPFDEEQHSRGYALGEACWSLEYDDDLGTYIGTQVEPGEGTWVERAWYEYPNEYGPAY